MISKAEFVSSSTRVSQKPPRRLPEFAFIGRSNVGKSSLINMLCSNGKLAKTSSTPGKTRLVNHFLINDSWYLVDLPGYGYAKMPQRDRDELSNVISDYILNSPDLVMLFVLVDSRFEITRIDRDFITRLGEHGIPFAIVYTKSDKQGPNVLKATIEKNCRALAEDWDELPRMISTSSLNGNGRQELTDYIETILQTL